MKSAKQARLDNAMRSDMDLARSVPGGARVGRSGRHVMRVHVDAAMHAVDTEGPEVMSSAADGYWRDMCRRYPHIDMAGMGGLSAGSAKGRNRFGKISERLVFRDGRMVTIYKRG